MSLISKQYGLSKFICKIDICRKYDFRLLPWYVFILGSIEKCEDSNGSWYRRYLCIGSDFASELLARELRT